MNVNGRSILRKRKRIWKCLNKTEKGKTWYTRSSSPFFLDFRSLVFSTDQTTAAKRVSLECLYIPLALHWHTHHHHHHRKGSIYIIFIIIIGRLQIFKSLAKCLYIPCCTESSLAYILEIAEASTSVRTGLHELDVAHTLYFFETRRSIVSHFFVA